MSGGPEPVAAEALLAQYLSLAINGEPPMGEGRSALDGKAVYHLSRPEFSGEVLGPSLLDGFVWVRWGGGNYGLHREVELREVSDGEQRG